MLRKLLCWVFGCHGWNTRSVMDRDGKGRLYHRAMAECEDCGAVKRLTDQEAVV